MTEYIVNAMVWSGLGLVVGFMLGMGWRVKFQARLLTERSRERMVGAALIALALASTAQSLVYQRHQSDITDCQTRYNEEFQKTLRERAATADQDRLNTYTMVRGAIEGRDVAARRQAITNYIKINEEITEARRKQQFPRNTGRVCR